jgi:serine/threonine-protein kinase
VNDDDFPQLPPMSRPPEAIAAELRAIKAHARAMPASLIQAPMGMPSPDVLRVTFADEVILNNKFRVLKQLAAHEDVLVYEAIHTGTSRGVQLHVLPSGLAADGPAAQKMMRAARAAGRVPHPNVLSVVDSGTDEEGRPFLVYERFDGAPVTELVERYGPFAPRKAAEVMMQVLDALQALHTRGVLHRNIRPENLLIELGVSTTRVKIRSFEHAFVRAKGGPLPDLPKGYSRYLAPEARRGISTAEPGIDIYAAGVLMRYLLTGETDPALPVDDKAARAIERATAGEEDERFQSAEQFRSAVLLLLPEEGRADSIVPSDPLAADLRYLSNRREREGPMPTTEEGRLELKPVLMFVEAIYALLGGAGWQRVIAEVPDCEQLLPAAGRAEELRAQGVPVELVSRMLVAADHTANRGELGFLPFVGYAMVEKGVGRFCPQLPKQLSPAVLVDCVSVLWSSLSRQGEVVIVERLDDSARVAVRNQVEPSLEVTAVMAGLLRAMMRHLSREGEVSVVASQAVGDPADIFVLRWS